MTSTSRYADESTMELVVGLALDTRDIAACHLQKFQRKLQRGRPGAGLALVVASTAAAAFFGPKLRKPPAGLVGAMAMHAGRRWALEALRRVATST